MLEENRKTCQCGRWQPGGYRRPGAPPVTAPRGEAAPGAGKNCPGGTRESQEQAPHCLGNGPQPANLEVRESLTCHKSDKRGAEQDPQLPQPLLPREHQHPGAATTPGAVRGAHCDEWDYKYNWTDNKALIRLLRL